MSIGCSGYSRWSSLDTLAETFESMESSRRELRDSFHTCNAPSFLSLSEQAYTQYFYYYIEDDEKEE